MPTALVMQHEPDGPAALAGDRLVHHGFDLKTVQVLDGDSPHSDVEFPDPREFDLIMTTGSVHSVYDHDRIGSWIGREVELLRAAHDGGTAIFGICFGAQALCVALGGTVERSPSSEVGWVEIDSDDESIVPAGPWFTWHDDRCVLPSGVVELARSPIAPQAFRAGSSMAVQFHPEVDRDLVAGWMSKCDDDYFAARAADRSAMLEGFTNSGERSAANLHLMLDRFVDEVAG
ncbi:MAG: type 1 glutamine amidotransferase [Ilumatobacteraceae bacterium]